MRQNSPAFAPAIVELEAEKAREPESRVLEDALCLVF
jgi:hypothetical protein